MHPYHFPFPSRFAAAIVVVAAAIAHAGSIGVKYVRSDALAATDTAGAGTYAQANWNMGIASVGGFQGTPVTPMALKDNTGAATNASLTSWTQSTINSWSLGDTGSPNAKLLNSFSDQQPTVSFSGLDTTFPNGYTVVVYYSNNEGPSVSTLTLTGTVNDSATRSIRTGPTASCKYSAVGFVQETGAVQPATSSTNYTVFTGFNDPGLTIALTGSNNNGIAAIQLVGNITPPSPPATPATPSPADAATGVTTTSVLDWADAANATGYQVFLWTDGATEPATATASPTTSTYSPTSALAYSTTYHWQVKAVNSAGTTAGPLWTFTTAAAPAIPAIIGWKNKGMGNDPLATTDLAGAPPYAQTNWNNHASNGQAPGNVPLALKDSTGATTGASVTAWTQSSNNSWSLGETNTPNEKLLNSFSDQQPSVTFSNIPVSYMISGYSVVVYYANNEGPSTSTLTLTGSINDLVSRSIRTGDTSKCSYRNVGFVKETGTLAGPTNYTIFTGLNDPAFTLAITGLNNNGLSAVQIVQSAAPPPPVTITVPAGYSNTDITDDLGAGNASDNYNLLGNATFGATTGILAGNISVTDPFTLTLNTGGNTTLLLGVLSGTGKVTINGSGATLDCMLGGSSANTLTGNFTLSQGTLALAKPAGANAIASSQVIVGGGTSQAVLHWDAADQIIDIARITLLDPSLAVLDFNGFAETVGTLALSGNGELWLGSGAAVIHFTASAAESWTAGKSLLIREWDGKPAGGGTDRIFFGSSTAGLTTSQLAQITFVNPTGFPTGNFPAKILSSGEIVPNGTPLDYVNVPDGYVNNDIKDDLGAGSAATNYTLLGNAQIGWGGGTLTGYFSIPATSQTLTMDTAGGNSTSLNGILKGAGNLIWIGGGSTTAWQTTASFLGGTAANTLTGIHTLTQGTLALAKPDGVTAIAGSVVVGGGANQAILRWDANDQIADTSTVTVRGPYPAYLNLNGHRETMGALVLAGDGELDLGTSPALVHFADSTSQAWAPAKQFVICQWNGSPTGGASQGVFFGTSANGLTAGQLAAVGFLNPAGFTPGLYHAAMLATGEVVPTGNPVVATNPPYDFSPAATATRTANYTSTGMADLTASGSPLATGTHIVFFGDSITWLNGYIGLLNTAIGTGAGTQGKTITLVNRGINGGTAANIRDGASSGGYPGSVAQASFSSLLTSDQATIAVVFIGINDIWWAGTTAADYEQTLRDMAASAAAKGVKLIFATPAAHNESPVGADSLDPAIDQFANIVYAVASDTGASFVDLRTAFVSYWKNNNYQLRLDGTIVPLQSYGILTYDGVHPTTLGNQLIANLMATGILTSIGGTTTAFETWAGTGGKGLTGANAAFTADPDHDGISNGLEFLLGGDPNPAHLGSNSRSLLPTASRVGNNLVFSFTHRHEAAALNPVVEFTDNLSGAWTPATDPGNATISVIPGSQADTVNVTLPHSANSRLFARLRVDPPAPAPTLTMTPQDTALATGGSTTLTARASGDRVPSWQWYLNGNAIPGATGSSYTITNATTSNQGFYQVVASNAFGDTPSPLIHVTVSATPGTASLNLIPWPLNVQPATGDLTIQPGARIVATDPTLLDAANVLATGITAAYARPLPVVTATPTDGDIVLALDPTLADERHTLSVNSRATVCGNNAFAVSLGTATLLQALRNQSGTILCPRCTIDDTPAVGIRALSLDLARQDHSLESLLQAVDLCHLYKINYLHLHFNDDQAYTFPSTAYPLLNTVTTSRGRLVYSLADMQTLEAYAVARGVHIMPELEGPGHNSLMLAAYPSLFQITYPYDPNSTDVNYPKYLPSSSINVARADVRAAVRTLIGEMCAVFQSTPCIHIGCDEVDWAWSQYNTDFQAAFAQWGFDRSDPSANVGLVFSKFITLERGYAAEFGKQSIVWENSAILGSPEVPTPTDVLVEPFDCYNPAEFPAVGLNMVNSAWSPLYLVNDIHKPVSSIYAWDRTIFGQYSGTAVNYTSHVVPAQYVTGTQLTTFEQPEDLEMMSTRLRIPAMNERTWIPTLGASYDNFRSRLTATDAVLDSILSPVRVTYSGLDTPDDRIFSTSATITLSLAPGFANQGLTIRYTTSATNPTITSTLYTGPFQVTTTGYLRAAAFNSSGQRVGFIARETYRHG